MVTFPAAGFETCSRTYPAAFGYVSAAEVLREIWIKEGKNSPAREFFFRNSSRRIAAIPVKLI
jgi:hypothetical protein